MSKSPTDIAAGINDAASMHENRKRGQVLYIIAHPCNAFKIGISQNPLGRIETLQQACPFELGLLTFEGFRRPELAESILHDHFSEYHIHYEWFDIPDQRIKQLVADENKRLREIVFDSDEYPYDRQEVSD